MFGHKKAVLLLVLFVAFSGLAPAQDASLLTLDRIFNSGDFSPKGIGGLRWMKSRDAFSKIERSTTVQGGQDLVSYDAATNARTVLVAAEKLIPKGETKPLPLNGYEWSADNTK